MSQPQTESQDAGPLRQELTLLDATSVIVSIVIGSAIYEKAPQIAASSTGWMVAWRERLAGGGQLTDEQLRLPALVAVIGVWLLGGVLAYVGAMCYAELATAYPRAGGSYVYLTRAFGRRVGLAFAWAEFWIVRPGNIGAIAFVMAHYAAKLAPQFIVRLPHHDVLLAVLAIVALAAINAAGLRAGTRTQNLLTACKVIGLIAIFVTAMTASAPEELRTAPLAHSGSLSLAMIFVMFAYGGWADMAYVAAEIRDPARNISRALAVGTIAVAAIYILINLAFASALGIGGMAQSEAVAADVLALQFGAWGARAMSLLICISCLGTIHSMLFTGARVYYALGSEHKLFAWLGQWNRATGVPFRSLAIQTVVTVGMVVAFGLYQNGFDRLIVFSGPFFWGFIALVGVALIVLRQREGTAGRLFRVPLYPLTPVVLIVSSGLMVYATASYAISNLAWEASWAAVVIVSGLIVMALSPAKES